MHGIRTNSKPYIVHHLIVTDGDPDYTRKQNSQHSEIDDETTSELRPLRDGYTSLFR